MLRTACLLLAILLFTGCNIGITRPEVVVTGVRMDEVTDGGARVLFDLLVVNPNDEELPMPTVSYRVDVVGAGSFELTDRPYASLPRNGQTTFTLAAAVSGVNLPGKRVTIDGEVVFEPQGELRKLLYDNYVPLPSSDFSGEGVLE
jgi:LEA14-like dessication related protein